MKLTLVGVCNDKPKSNEVNDAVARRIMDIPFKSKFLDQHEYDKLNDEEKKNAGVKNVYYKTSEFKDKNKQALFLILIEHYKEYMNNNRVLPITEEIINRNNEYLAKSDEFLSWFEDNYEKTSDKKDVMKLKLVYEKFKHSEYFNNLNKIQKRQNNYNNFVEKLQSNIFLKRYVTENKDKTKIITNYKNKINDDYDESFSALDTL